MSSIHKIFKYQLSVGPVNRLAIPKGAVIRHVGKNTTGPELYLWVEVDPELEVETRVFLVFGTGWEIENPDQYHFVGTVICERGFVWHVFEEKK